MGRWFIRAANPTAVSASTALRRRSAAGVEAVAVTVNRAAGQMGPLRATNTLRQLNQAHGFDCMGCAWADPDPEHRLSGGYGLQSLRQRVQAVGGELTWDAGSEHFRLEAEIPVAHPESVGTVPDRADYGT